MRALELLETCASSSDPKGRLCTVLPRTVFFARKDSRGRTLLQESVTLSPEFDRRGTTSLDARIAERGLSEEARAQWKAGMPPIGLNVGGGTRCAEQFALPTGVTRSEIRPDAALPSLRTMTPDALGASVLHTCCARLTTRQWSIQCDKHFFIVDE